MLLIADLIPSYHLPPSGSRVHVQTRSFFCCKCLQKICSSNYVSELINSKYIHIQIIIIISTFFHLINYPNSYVIATSTSWNDITNTTKQKTQYHVALIELLFQIYFLNLYLQLLYLLYKVVVIIHITV
jgi:hypothetical protein